MFYITQYVLMVKLYDRSLTPALKEFDTEEGISWIIFNETEDYVEYQLNCLQDEISDVEQRLMLRLHHASN
jgi:hypothetical protein